MPQVRANGIDIEYESFGSSDDEAILLIMGLGSQLIHCPVELCETLVAHGYRVIRYDNRDCGLSSRMESYGLPDMRSVFTALRQGHTPGAPYALEDMAADAIGLLDTLGIERAHIVGASMGGMIAQLLAAHYPDRVFSLTSIMSSSGNPLLPSGKPQAMSVLMTPSPPWGDMEAIVEHGVGAYRTVGSPGFPADENVLRQQVRRAAERSYYPQGIVRQMAAVMTNGDRRTKLRRIKAPTVVLHGADDPLLPVEAGKDTAVNIPGAELRVIPGMGHDMPVSLMPLFAEAILAAAERGSPRRVVKPKRVKEHATPLPAISEIMVESLPEPETASGIPEMESHSSFIGRLRGWLGQASS